jgi:hypothetical protein
MQEEEFGSITDQEVYEAICRSEVIETYPDDTPYPSVLIFGMTDANRPLHVVCAYVSVQPVKTSIMPPLEIPSRGQE